VQHDEEAFFLPTNSVVSPWYLRKDAAWLVFVVKLVLASSIESKIKHGHLRHMQMSRLLSHNHQLACIYLFW
jgi:hypothetical protein